MLSRLDEITRDNKDLFEKLDQKVSRVRHLEVYYDKIIGAKRKHNDRVTKELHEIKQQNREFEQEINMLKDEINKLQRLAIEKNIEFNELSIACKQLMHSNSSKLEELKIASDTLDAHIERIDELKHLISSLKKRNSKREKDINKMAQKADALMTQYTELKEKAVAEKNRFFKCSREYNLTVGSRIMEYALNAIYIKRMGTSMGLLKGFSQFDKDFMRGAKRLVSVYMQKSQITLKNVLHKWYNTTLIPSRTVKAHKAIDASLKTQKEEIEKFITTANTKIEFNRKIKAIKEAKEKLHNIFSKITKREKKRMFDLWHHRALDIIHKETLLKTLFKKFQKHQISLYFTYWRSSTTDFSLNHRLTHYIKSESKTQYLQTIFSHLRSALSTQKTERLSLLRKAWDSLLHSSRTQKHLKICQRILEKQSCKNSYTRAQRALYALRLNAIQEKASLFEQGLAIELPLKEEAEGLLSDEVQTTDHQRLHDACEVISTQLSKSLFSYFQQWRDVITTQKYSLRYKILHKIAQAQYYKKRLTALSHWKTHILSLKKAEISNLVNKGEWQNEGLIHGCKGLVNTVNAKLVTTKTKATFKILRFFRKQNYGLSKVYFGRWKGVIEGYRERYEALRVLEGYTEKLRLQQVFGVYKKQIKDLRRFEVIQVRQAYVQSSYNSNMRQSVFDALFQYKCISKMRKTRLCRLVKRKENTKLFAMFKTWNNLTLKTTEHDHKIYKENQISKVKHQNTTKLSYSDKLTNIKSGSENLQTHLQKQSHQILKKYLLRTLKSTLESTFQHWQTQTHRQTLIQSTLKTLFFRLKSQYQLLVFTHWKTQLASNTLNSSLIRLNRKSNELASLISLKEQRKDEFSAEFSQVLEDK